jgi:hypothetical protein
VVALTKDATGRDRCVKKIKKEGFEQRLKTKYIERLSTLNVWRVYRPIKQCSVS